MKERSREGGGGNLNDNRTEVRQGLKNWFRMTRLDLPFSYNP
jgi:hypothetical protein